MTCSIVRPDPQTLFNRVRDMFSATVLGGAQVVPESNEWYVVSNDYAMQEQFYAISEQMWKETDPRFACCDNLYAMAIRNGVFPRPATFAQTYVRLHGMPGAALTTPLEFSIAGIRFVSTGSVPSALDSNGTAIVNAKSTTPGTTANSAGDVTSGTLITVLTGVNTAVDVCGGFVCGGQDAETCEQFRTRYLDRLAYHPRATSTWIQQKLLEYPCATRVCTREGACCRCDPECSDNCGCVGCGDKLQFYVMFDNSFPCGVAPQNIIDDITKWMFGEHQGYGEGQVEIGVCGKIYAVKPFEVDVHIDIEGCPTVSQKQQIESDVRDLFKKICPSIILRQNTVDLIVANIMGNEINVATRFDALGAPREVVYQSDCGDLEPECDYMPCLRNLYFTEGLTDAFCP